MSKLARFYSLITFALSLAMLSPRARPYVFALATVLGCVTLACTSLAAVLPGKARAALLSFAHDVDGLRDLFPRAPAAPAVPATLPPPGGAA